MSISFENSRREYKKLQLSEEEIDRNPFLQLQKWLKDANDLDLPDHNAMCLTTVSKNGFPSSRIVLLKKLTTEITGELFWVTNYESRKGVDMNSRPYAALLFYWPNLERQIRIEGNVRKTSDLDNQLFFKNRPLLSQIATACSNQSRQIKTREELNKQFEITKSSFELRPDCPIHWGGYALKPHYFEFWQGRESRLHDRIAYKISGDGWQTYRLQP